MRTLRLALCQGRHEIPEAVDGAVFAHEISDVKNTLELERKAFNGLWDAAYKHHKTGEPGFLTVDPNWDGNDATPLVFAKELTVDLYVTGLTVALIAVLNTCRSEGISITLWHFDRESGTYYPQAVR